MIRVRDLLERTVWTGIAASAGSLAGAALFDVDPWAAAGSAGLTAVIGSVLVIARYRLSILPDPGAGLPGLPTESDD